MGRFRIARLWTGEPAEDAEAVELELFLDQGRNLQVRIEAPYHGDPAPRQPPGPLDGLWEFEVVEVFLVGPDGRYTEAEFGPHGHHLVLRLEAPRAVRDRGHEIVFETSRSNRRWEGSATLPCRLLPGEICRIGLFAIHGTGPRRRYLSAHRLAGSSPDFHQPADFPAVSALDLQP